MTNTLTPTQTKPANGANAYVRPLANITEAADGYTLEVELPGVNKSGLEVTVENGELTLVGRRVAKAGPGNPVYRESRVADYRRVFELDSSIDAGKIAAKLENGILRLHLPKAESVKPRKIELAD